MQNTLSWDVTCFLYKFDHGGFSQFRSINTSSIMEEAIALFRFYNVQFSYWIIVSIFNCEPRPSVLKELWIQIWCHRSMALQLNLRVWYPLCFWLLITAFFNDWFAGVRATTTSTRLRELGTWRFICNPILLY